MNLPQRPPNCAAPAADLFSTFCRSFSRPLLTKHSERDVEHRLATRARDGELAQPEARRFFLEEARSNRSRLKQYTALHSTKDAPESA
jgi:hypothetical protein